MPHEAVYPGTKGLLAYGDLCTRPESKYQGEPYEFKDEGCYWLSGCEKEYPYAIGLSYNCLFES